jgi:hypothetical protein
MGTSWSNKIGSRENSIGKWSERGISTIVVIGVGWVFKRVRGV